MSLPPPYLYSFSSPPPPPYLYSSPPSPSPIVLPGSSLPLGTVCTAASECTSGICGSSTVGRRLAHEGTVCVAAAGAACVTSMDCASGYCDYSTYLCGASSPPPYLYSPSPPYLYSSPPSPSPIVLPGSNLPLGTVCTAASECTSGICGSSTVGRRLAHEGTVCVAAAGAACVTSMDCASGYCDYSTYLCGASSPPYLYSPSPPYLYSSPPSPSPIVLPGSNLPLGTVCTAASECTSGICGSSTVGRRLAHEGTVCVAAAGAACVTSMDCESGYCDYSTYLCGASSPQYQYSPSPPYLYSSSPPSPSPPPPPSPPPAMVVLTLTVSGSVSDYSDTSNLQNSIAANAGVPAFFVSVSVAAASVIITATITVPWSTTPDAVQTSLSVNLGTAVAASAALGITVQTDPSIVSPGSTMLPVATPGASSSPMPTPSTNLPLGAVCTAASECTSGICGSSSTIGRRLAHEGTVCVAADGAACATSTDCASGYCDYSTYLCGASSPPYQYSPSPPMSTGVATASSLAIGAMCTAATECASGMCGSSSTIGRRLAHEGTVCVAADGAACVTSTDCASGYCDYSTYLCGASSPPYQYSPSPPMSTGVATASSLAIGAMCTAATECASGMCGSSSTVGRRLAHEGTVCVAADGAACSTYMDCASGYCDYSTYLCGASPPSPPMSTGVATGSSVDMPANSFCYYDAECASSVCTFNVCQGRPDGDPCTNAAECSSYQCTLSVCGSANQLEDGQPCSIVTDCRSYFCTNGICGLAQEGSPCVYDSDCASMSCRLDLTCGAPSSALTNLPDGAICYYYTECASGVCTSGVCGLAQDGFYCQTDSDCVSNAWSAAAHVEPFS